MFRYNQYCPVAKTAEILGDRWTILIVRELIQETHRFNEFHRNLPGISRSVLSDRLRRLEDLGVVERQEAPAEKGAQYHLTQVGYDLNEVVVAMGNWGARWIVSDPLPQEQDPDIIMLFIARHLEETELPAKRVVVEFHLRAKRLKRRYWLVLEKGASSLCLQHPGFDSDLQVSAEVLELQRVYLGRAKWVDAVRSGAVEIEGPTALVRRFPRWMKWSKFAPIVAGRSAPDRS